MDLLEPRRRTIASSSRIYGDWFVLVTPPEAPRTRPNGWPACAQDAETAGKSTKWPMIRRIPLC